MSRQRQTGRGEWLKTRSTADLLILMVAGTITFSTLMYGAVVTALLFVQPDQNHGPELVLLTNTFQMLIGLLAGFIAGRTEGARTRPGGGDSDDSRQGHQ